MQGEEAVCSVIKLVCGGGGMEEESRAEAQLRLSNDITEWYTVAATN